MKAVEIYSMWKLIIPIFNIGFDKARNSWSHSNLLQVVVIREGVRAALHSILSNYYKTHNKPLRKANSEFITLIPLRIYNVTYFSLFQFHLNITEEPLQIFIGNHSEGFFLFYDSAFYISFIYLFIFSLK